MNSSSTSRNGMRGKTRSEPSHLPKRLSAPGAAAVPTAKRVAGAAISVLSARSRTSAMCNGLAFVSPSGEAGMPPSPRAVRDRSELVEIDPALHALAPDLDLVLAADVVGHLVPASLDAPGGLFGGDVLVHHVGEVIIKNLEVLVIPLQHQQGRRVFRVLERGLDHLGAEAGDDLRIVDLIDAIGIPEAARMGDRQIG